MSIEFDFRLGEPSIAEGNMPYYTDGFLIVFSYDREIAVAIVPFTLPSLFYINR